MRKHLTLFDLSKEAGNVLEPKWRPLKWHLINSRSRVMSSKTRGKVTERASTTKEAETLGSKEQEYSIQ